MPKAKTPKTLDCFLSELEQQNKTVAAWAAEHGFPLAVVYQVTRGRLVGNHGVSREIVRAMGLTPPKRFARRSEQAHA